MADITSGLIGWWKLDDGSGLSAVDSKNGNTGTLENGPTWSFPGRIGSWCLEFGGGNDQVNLQSPAILDNLTVLSLAGWVNFTADGYMIGKTNAGGTNGFLFGIINDGSGFYVRYVHDFTVVGNWKTDDGTVVVNQWHHIAVSHVVLAASTPVLYVDGKSVNVNVVSTPSGTPDDDSAANAYIGNRTAAPDGIPFVGKIDDVRIYSRILSASDVMELVNAPFAGNFSQPLRPRAFSPGLAR